MVHNSSSHVFNSMDFWDFISDRLLPSGHILVSFDVVSLFMSVPVKEIALDYGKVMGYSLLINYS